MKKGDATRSRAKAARTNKRHQQLDIQEPPPTPKLTPTLWQKAKRAWVHLQTWKKITAAVIATCGFVFAAFPHFSIDRATTNSGNPFNAVFSIQNIGWIPALNSDFQCTIDDDKFKISGGINTIKNIAVRYKFADVAWGHQFFTKGCRMSIPGAIPVSGGVKATVGFYFPLFPVRFESSQYFSFNYDSASGGYIYTKDCRIVLRDQYLPISAGLWYFGAVARENRFECLPAQSPRGHLAVLAQQPLV
jgi:hypothetical protein